jgi:hypothetical protein
VVTVEGEGVTETFTGSSSNWGVSVTNGSNWSDGQQVDVTVTATDNAGNVLNSTWYFTVASAGGPDNLAVTTTTLPDGTVGTEYNQQLAATGGTPPYLWSLGSTPYDPGYPYPPSTTIASVAWDFAGKIRTGQGSDLWPVTWAGDNNTYTAWGDGGGPDGSNTICRTRFGLNQMTGSPPSYGFTKIWGCKADDTGCSGSYTHDAACDAPYGGTAAASGVPDALTAIDNTLYALVADWSTYGYHLLKSTNYGQSWDNTNQSWPVSVGNFMPESFVSHGAGDAGGSATYVYVLGEKYGTAYAAYLARAPKATIDNAATWGYFTGTAGSPSWGAWGSATAIFYDAGATYAGGKIQYFPVIGKYIYTMVRTDIQKFGIFEGANPWGPWYTIAYYDTWGNYGVTGGLWHSIVPSSISGDDLTFYMTFSGNPTPDNWDNYNLIKGTFTLAAGADSLPPGLSLSSSGAIGPGIPSTVGTTAFGVMVTDSASPPQVDNQALSITVNAATPGGQVTVTGTAFEDAYLNGGAGTTNYSTGTELRTYDWPDYTVVNKIVLMDNATIQALPDNISITAATLRMYLTGKDGSGGYNPTTISAHNITGTVPTISTVTWNNFAGTVGAALSGTSVTLTPGWVEWNILSAVRSAYDTSQPIYIMLYNGTGVSDTNRIFASSEHATTSWKPQLVITYMQLTGPGGPSISAPGKFRVSTFRGKVN